MQTGHALVVISIVLTACAGSNARPAVAPLEARVPARSTAQEDYRIGPPSPRGLGLRRIDRPIAIEAPIARY
jgi:hypothetical protein